MSTAQLSLVGKRYWSTFDGRVLGPENFDFVSGRSRRQSPDVRR